MAMNQVMKFQANTNQLELVVIFEFLRRCSATGVLAVQSLSRGFRCFFLDGSCIFAWGGRQEGEESFDLVNLLPIEEKLKSEIRTFTRDHPQFLVDALDAVGIDLASLGRLASTTTRETLFRCLLLNDADYSFDAEDGQLPLLTADHKLVDLFRSGKYPGSDGPSLVSLAIKLNRIPVKSGLLEQPGEVDDLRREIHLALARNDTIRQLLRQFPEHDPFAVFSLLEQMEYSGEVAVESKYPAKTYPAYPGSDKIIDAVIETYRGIVPFFFDQAIDLASPDVRSMFSEAMAAIARLYPWLDQPDFSAAGISDFLNSVALKLERIEPQDKIVSLKRGLNSLLLELLLRKKESGSSDGVDKSLKNARGFLSFIAKAGSYDQRDQCRTIEHIFALVEQFDAASRPTAPAGVSRGAAELATVPVRDSSGNGDLAKGPGELPSTPPAGVAALADKNTLVRLMNPASLSRLNDPEIDGEDGFVLSRLLTPMSVGDLMALTGMREDVLVHRLQRYLHKKLIVLGAEITDIPAVNPGSVNQGESLSDGAAPLPDALTIESRPAPELPAFSAAQAQKILKLELFELSALCPHELFGLNPNSTKTDFETSLRGLRQRFCLEAYPHEIRAAIGPLIGRINSLINQAAESLGTCFTNQPASPQDQVCSETPIVPSATRQAIEKVPPQPLATQSPPRTENERIAGQPETSEAVKPKPSTATHDHEPAAPAGSERKRQAQDFYSQGMKYRGQGDHEKAIDAFDRAIHLTPENFFIHQARERAVADLSEFRAELLYTQAGEAGTRGDFKESARLLKEVIGLAPTNPRNYDSLARVMAEHLGKFKEAEYYCRKALEMEPGNSDYYLLLGRIFKAQGMIKEAREQFLDALRWNKNNKEARQELNRLP